MSRETRAMCSRSERGSVFALIEALRYRPVPDMSATHVQPIPQSGDGPRQRLLDGLRQAIREQGLPQLTISDIVRNARTSKRTFYECFADKDACLVELAEEWAGAL